MKKLLAVLCTGGVLFSSLGPVFASSKTDNFDYGFKYKNCICYTRISDVDGKAFHNRKLSTVSGLFRASKRLTETYKTTNVKTMALLFVSCEAESKRDYTATKGYHSASLDDGLVVAKSTAYSIGDHDWYTYTLDV